jgi:hypothetical protein
MATCASVDHRCVRPSRRLRGERRNEAGSRRSLRAVSGGFGASFAGVPSGTGTVTLKSCGNAVDRDVAERTPANGQRKKS